MRLRAVHNGQRLLRVNVHRRARRRDLQIQRRADVADVADVGRAGAGPGVIERVVRLEPLRAQVGLAEPRERRRREKIVQRRVRLRDSQRRARHQRRALCDVLDLLNDFVEIGALLGAHKEFRGGRFRDDVRRRAAVRDDAVHADVGTDVLAQRVDAGEQELHRVERVDAVPGGGGGVGRPAAVGKLEAVHGERPAGGVCLRMQMGLNGRGRVVKDALAGHDDLSAVALLRRRSDEPYHGPDLAAPHQLRHHHGGSAGRRGDPVVAAGMGGAAAVAAVARQRVVFRREVDLRPVRAEDGDEGGIHAAYGRLHGKAAAPHIVHQIGRRFSLLHPKLRVRENIAADLLQLAGVLLFDLLRQPKDFFQIHGDTPSVVAF